MMVPADLCRRALDVGDPRRGPTLVVVGSIHGDEPAGTAALYRLRDQLPTPAGRIVGLVGNLAALRARTRYIDVDLNRCWTRARMAALEPNASPLAEHRELIELSAELESLWTSRSRAHPFVVLDLHTTSGAGPPFAMLSLRDDELAFGRRLPIVKVVGIEAYVEGALLSFLSQRGAISLGFEAGQHQAPESVEHHQALVWVAASELGMVEAAPTWWARLAAVQPPLPGEIAVAHRHQVRPGDGFRMRPGHRHLEPVEAGALLADDARGPIRAPLSGYLLMPSYGAKGEDGFFIGRPV